MNTSDVWGVGSRIAKRLSVIGIDNALALARMKPGLARKNFNIELERTVRELNGQVCKQWDQVRADKQQIFSTRSVGKRITNLTSLQQALSKHVSIACEKMRQQGSLCSAMLIFASNSPYDELPSGFKHTYKLPFPTHDSCELTQAVREIAKRYFRADIRYYKLGVGMLDLVNAKQLQLDLFNQCSAPELMQALDGVNQRYGTNTLFLAAQGIEQKWHMRRELLTPQYTTCWHDIPKIRC